MPATQITSNGRLRRLLMAAKVTRPQGTPLAGHHDLVRIEHAAAALRKLVDQPLREDLVAVREVEVEHGVGIAAAGCVL